MVGYEERPQQQQNIPLAQQPQGYPEGYEYQGDTFRGQVPNDQAAQVRLAIFNCPLPETDEEFGKWIPMLATAVDMVARIPGIDHNVVNELNLRMELIVDRSHSQGRPRAVASKMQKLIFRLRSYVSMADTPMQGMTGIGAMVTTNQKQEQIVRMPQQPSHVGFWGNWSKRQQ
jgi:hypothetical protein